MKSTPPAPWSIGDLAGRFELPTHVLRHWEDEGLLAPERDGAGRRRYRESDAYRVATIMANKEAGMSLDQVRALLDASAEDRRAILEQHLVDLSTRQAAIERSRHMTEHALQCRAHDIAECPNFRAHVGDIVAGERTGLWPKGAGHAHGPAASHDAHSAGGQATRTGRAAPATTDV